MLKVILAIVGGLVLAFLLVFAFDALFHMLSPTAERPTTNDADALRAYVARQSTATLAGIVVGWAISIYAGAWVATRFARRGNWPGWVVTGLFLLATAANFLIAPHPLWMMALSVVLILGGGWLGIRSANPTRRPLR